MSQIVGIFFPLGAGCISTHRYYVNREEFSTPSTHRVCGTRLSGKTNPLYHTTLQEKKIRGREEERRERTDRHPHYRSETL